MDDEVMFVDEKRQYVSLVHVMAARLLEPHMADILSSHLCEQLDAGAKYLLVDLGNVQRLSSLALRSFIMVGKKAGEKKVRLAFCNLSPVIREGFEITGLTNLFPVYSNESEAMAKMPEA